MAGRTGVSAGLKEIVADYEGRGVDLSADPRLAEAILLDSFPEAPAEIHALVEAIRSGAIQSMRDRAGQGTEFSIHGSAAQLTESAGLREDLARWAVESWWNALSLGTPIDMEPKAPVSAGGAAAGSPPPPPPPPPPPTPGPPAAMPTAQPLTGSTDMTQTAGEAAPVGSYAAGPPAGSTTPPPPSGAGPLPYAPGAPIPTPAGSATGAPAYTPPQPSYAAGPQTYGQGGSYPPGGQYPPGPPGPPTPPTATPAQSSRGKLLVVGIIVVIVLAYVGIAAAAKLPPFKKAAVATTTTTLPTTTTFPHTTTTATSTTTTLPTTTTVSGAAATLLAAIPDTTKNQCTPLTASQINTRAQGASAAVDCTPASGLDVLYALWPSKAVAQSVYDTTIKDAIPKGLPSGACQTTNDVEGTYTVNKVTAGDLACFSTKSFGQSFFWWHTSDNIDTLATSQTLSRTAMYNAWESLGPS